MALRKLVPDIPVILAAATKRPRSWRATIPNGPQAFLGKPYKLKGLSDAISQALIHKKKPVAS